jgi:hypothetical protein
LSTVTATVAPLARRSCGLRTGDAEDGDGRAHATGEKQCFLHESFLSVMRLGPPTAHR